MDARRHGGKRRTLSFEFLEPRQLLATSISDLLPDSMVANPGISDQTDVRVSAATALAADSVINHEPNTASPSGLAHDAIERTYAEWNAADRQGNIRLSNNNLTVETRFPPAIGSLSDSVRATQGKRSGRWYFELQITKRSISPINALGVGTKRLNLESSPGLGDIGCGYRASGDVYCNHSGTYVRFDPYGEGDVIGVAVDLNRQKVFFSKNGVWQGGIAAPNLLGRGLRFQAREAPVIHSSERQRFYPAINISAGDSYTANFGARPFHDAAPPGFRSGWFVTQRGNRIFAEWNPADRQPNIVLSNDNLSAETALVPGGPESDSLNDTIRATIGKAKSKWYFEVLVAARSDSGYNAIGTATKLLNLEIAPGAHDNGCGYQAYGYVECKQRQITANFQPYGAGDVIGVAADMDDNRAYFSKTVFGKAERIPIRAPVGLRWELRRGFRNSFRA